MGTYTDTHTRTHRNTAPPMPTVCAHLHLIHLHAREHRVHLLPCVCVCVCVRVCAYVACVCLRLQDYARCVWPPPYSQLGSVELAHLLDQLNDECESVRLIETLQTTQAEQTEGNSAQPDRGPMQTSHGKGLDDSSSTSSSGTTACTVADNGISGGSMSVSSTSACAIASGVITVSHFLPSQSLL